MKKKGLIGAIVTAIVMIAVVVGVIMCIEREDARECAGNCTECAITDGGCWSLKSGEQVVFNEH